MTEQGYPPRQPDPGGRPQWQGRPGSPGRPRRPQRPGRSATNQRSGWQQLDAFGPTGGPEAEAPPWAGLDAIGPARPDRRPRPRPDGPDPYARAAGGPTTVAEYPEPVAEPYAVGEPFEHVPDRTGRPGRSRAARARRRKSLRRLAALGGVLALVAIVAGIIEYENQPHTQPSPYVTTYQPGEYRAVPNACHVVPAAVLGNALGGTPKVVQTFNFAAQSQCSYTVEAKPVFRILTVKVEAFQTGAYGNGSATANARYMFTHWRQQYARPLPGTLQSPPTITPIGGLGTAAFSAARVIRGGSITDDGVTVVVLYRNVQITADFKAQVSGGYGPASNAQLQAGAVAAARALLAAVKAAPAVS